MNKVLEVEEFKQLQCCWKMKDYIDGWFYNRRHGYFKKYKNHDFIFIVQYAFDEVIGIIGVECCESERLFYISPLYVKEDYRNEGVATGLIEKMKELSKKLEYEKCYLTCSDDLIEFYKKVGFNYEGLKEQRNVMAYYNKQEEGEK